MFVSLYHKVQSLSKLFASLQRLDGADCNIGWVFAHTTRSYIPNSNTVNSSVKESYMWDQLQNRMSFRTGHSTQHGLNKQFCQRAEGWSGMQVVDRER